MKLHPQLVQHLKFATKTITFTGAANLGQAGTNATIFTVTGQVLVVAISTFCTTNLAEAAPTSTVALGVVNATGLFVNATSATTINVGEFWHGTTPVANGEALPAAVKDIAITQDIVIASAAQNTTAGVLEIYCYWMPLSAGSILLAA